MNAVSGTILSIFTLIVTVAVVAVIFSQKAQTSAVIQALSSGIGNDIGTAISPITGTTAQVNLGFPTANALTG